MSNIDIKNLTALLTIAQRTLDWHAAVTGEKLAWQLRDDGYRKFKGMHDLDRVERGSVLWNRMLAATKDEHAALVRAKRVTYNARRRLDSAVRGYNRNGGAL